MLALLDNLLIGQPKWVIALLTLVLVAVLGSIDQLTGQELSFSVFYLVPISVAAWYGNRVMGYFASGTSAGTWLLVERISSAPYSQQWIFYWNGTVRFLFFVVVAWLAAELHATLVRHRRLSRTDGLTGLLNRSGLIAHAGRIVAVASRYGQATAFAYIDLDRFKTINDTQGHSRGDDVLKSVGALLEQSSRESDLVARLGGDEFAMLLPNTGLKGARSFFNKLHEQLRRMADEMDCAALGFSIGAIVFEAGPPSLDEALRRADALMYRAKRTEGIVVEAAMSIAATPAGATAADG